ncbi:MAG TPA: sialidase family protein [Terriglobales bacterium]|nr:sialidase family protein [Terriglobales bacterium]
MALAQFSARRLVLLVISFSLICVLPGFAQGTLTQLSQDTFTNQASQHQSEVEPGAYSYGSTIVTGFQVARIYGGGGADIGFATSTDGGLTWVNGYLPNLTVYEGNGIYQAASDAAVTYDALHNVWLISVLPIGNNTAVAVSRSFDGVNWSDPIAVTNQGSPDKNWIVCDNSPTSKFYGHCYSEWDDTEQGDLIEMSTSTDGGMTWSPEKTTAGSDYGIGGVPVVKPNGLVIVPINGFNEDVIAFTSSNGGKSWTKAVEVASDIEAYESGGLRGGGLVSSAIDAKGKVYVAWSDCRYRANCTSNDIVYTTSTNGKKWTAVQRVPIDDVSSTADHFITGLAIDPATSGKKAHLALAYYYYPNYNCSMSSCQLYLGFIQSSTAGKTWSSPVTLAGPMKIAWLPDTFSGYMVADYISVGFADGKAFPIGAVAQANTGTTLHEAIYTTSTGQAPSREEEEFLTAEGDIVVNTHSAKGPRQYLDQENRIPVSGQRPPEED